MKVSRYELKYYINYNDCLPMAALLRSALMPDKNNQGDKGYFIRSLYFDNLYDNSFYEKMAGVEKRKKYRLRIYSTKDEQVKFEIKNKLNNNIFKEAAFITKGDALKVINQDYEVLLKYKNKILNKIYCTFKKEKFKPVVVVDYYREAFIQDFNNIRITFDRLLSKSPTNFNIFSPFISTQPVLRGRKLIMEVKYNDFMPSWIKKIIQTMRFDRCAISKYCLSRMGD